MANAMTLGVDLGGTSSKATLIDEQGAILAVSDREYPSPGYLLY